MAKGIWHLGQRIFFPGAIVAGTFNLAWHWGQATVVIAMVLSPARETSRASESLPFYFTAAWLVSQVYV
jgi:hypothetical protein